MVADRPLDAARLRSIKIVASDIETNSDRSKAPLSSDERGLYGIVSGFKPEELGITRGHACELGTRGPPLLRRLILNCEQRTRKVPTVHPTLSAISSARSPWSTHDLILVITMGVSFLRCGIARSLFGALPVVV
jgi:hypothetical protein